jgi:hypothetical protein
MTALTMTPASAQPVSGNKSILCMISAAGPADATRPSYSTMMVVASNYLRSGIGAVSAHQVAFRTVANSRRGWGETSTAYRAQ